MTHTINTVADGDGKAFANLQAQFALRGHTLTKTISADGHKSYLCTRWGLVRSLRDLDEARQFLHQVGGTE